MHDKTVETVKASRLPWALPLMTSTDSTCGFLWIAHGSSGQHLWLQIAHAVVLANERKADRERDDVSMEKTSKLTLCRCASLRDLTLMNWQQFALRTYVKKLDHLDIAIRSCSRIRTWAGEGRSRAHYSNWYNSREGGMT